ncbi:sulfite exporter TauE/SafE family protein [Azospirillum sp.]|uniref:sulfite exporter TauE/SafE family protein n=1 Tax=Azospirillum sp. TaxID=34012 RepID=UPI002D23EE93|nr:sulfite exporter TauE/SafE family protein [Azospirillum sp.]HYD67360.1 sulfite exporter TauE/SafE family protein [Azospirillum sp.]
MNLYLPIAEMSLNMFLPIALGAGVGILTGMFGVGGGFLMTPSLIFIGVPPAVAVATEAMKIVGSSVSGVLAHWRRGNVDVKMGAVLLLGGLAGSFVGVQIFSWLRSLGQIDVVIALLYVVVLGIVGSMMFVESIRSVLRARNVPEGTPADLRPRDKISLAQRLPGKMVFRRSRLVVSPIMPFGVGALVGVLSALMGVGGGFIMVPAMIYLIGMPTKVVIGTSLFQIIFVTANTAFLQAVSNHTVDLMLALMLLIGGVIGAQVGSWLGAKLKAEQLRIGLAALVLAVCFKMALGLILEPDELYSYAARVGGH